MLSKVLGVLNQSAQKASFERGRWYESLIILATSGAAALLLLRTQQRWPDIGTRWDSLYYVEIAQDLLRAERPSTDAPFVYRLLFPALAAALSPSDVVRGMSRITFVSAVLSPLLMWWWLKTFAMNQLVRYLLVVAFVLSVFGPFRFGLFYPTLNYSLFAVFFLGGLVLVRKIQNAHGNGGGGAIAVLIATTTLGVLIRESMLIVPIALLCVSSSFRKTAHQRRIRITGLVTLAIGAITFVLVHLFVQSTNSYTFITAAKYWLETKSLLQLAAALFLAFGPMLAVIAAFPTATLRFWNTHREVPAVVVICLLLGVVGGTNTEVFLYWSAPCILVTVGHPASRILASRIGVLALTLVATFQLIAQRAFMQFPLVVEADSIPLVFLAPLGDAAYLQLWSQFAQPEILHGVVLSNLVVSLFLVVVLRASTRSIRRPEFRMKMVSADTGPTY